MGDINVFNNHKRTAMDEHFAQETISHLNWNEFLNLIMHPSFNEDTRPLFIMNLFETVSDNFKNQVFENLSHINRQIFIATQEDCISDNLNCKRIFANKVWDIVDT